MEVDSLSATSAEAIEEENDLFYFESDHLALKGNKDYSELLKTIFILEAQRERAIKDYDEVVQLHKEVLDDPELFLMKIKQGEPLGVPDLQMIAEVPNIHWSKYHVALPEEGLKFFNVKNGQNTGSDNVAKPKSNLTNKLDTFNKAWTTQEQRRLEELLIVYPPEPIELRRFKKIANALGNRTVKQVSSRVQKYFLKLYKAGLPIPGRMPKYAERSKKSKLHLHQRLNHYLFKPTTFFPQLDVPVVMNESEEFPGPTTDQPSTSDFRNNYLIPGSSQTMYEQKPLTSPRSEMDMQLELLQKVKFEKQTETDFQSSFRHFGYKCDFCNEEPIIGTRWHCVVCDNSSSVDFCNDCVISQMYYGNAHPLSHSLQPLRCNDVISSNTTCSGSSRDSFSGLDNDDSNRNIESSDDEELSSGESNDITRNSGDEEYVTGKYDNNEEDDDSDNYEEKNMGLVEGESQELGTGLFFETDDVEDDDDDDDEDYDENDDNNTEDSS